MQLGMHTMPRVHSRVFDNTSARPHTAPCITSSPAHMCAHNVTQDAALQSEALRALVQEKERGLAATQGGVARLFSAAAKDPAAAEGAAKDLAKNAKV